MSRAHYERLAARQRTIEACDRSAVDGLHQTMFVPRPVDVTDAKQFPNIAAAVAHARALRGDV